MNLLLRMWLGVGVRMMAWVGVVVERLVVRCANRSEVAVILWSPVRDEPPVDSHYMAVLAVFGKHFDKVTK